MLAEAGQGMNGRVIALHETYITIVAESTFNDSITFDETVRVYGKSLPGVLRGRIGIVVRRDGDRWTAGRCDVVPGWRMANALGGRPPCPKPGVRISARAHRRPDRPRQPADPRRRHHAAARLRADGASPPLRPAGHALDHRDLHVLPGRQVPRDDPRRGRLRAGLRHDPQALRHREGRPSSSADRTARHSPGSHSGRVSPRDDEAHSSVDRGARRRRGAGRVRRRRYPAAACRRAASGSR